MTKKKDTVKIAPTLSIICVCGNTSSFSQKGVDGRTFFGKTEKVFVGEVDNFTIDVYNPITNTIELYCKSCGNVYRINNGLE